MKAWWHNLSNRDRGGLILALAVAAGAAGWVGIWEPVAAAGAQERARIAGQKALLDWIETVTPQARQLQQRGDRARGLEGRSLLGVVDETARAAGLAGALQRIEPGGEDQVRVWLEGADFQRLMSWLERLAGERPVVIQEFQAERAGTAGRVNARLTLAMASS